MSFHKPGRPHSEETRALHNANDAQGEAIARERKRIFVSRCINASRKRQSAPRPSADTGRDRETNPLRTDNWKSLAEGFAMLSDDYGSD